jgi:transposase
MRASAALAAHVPDPSMFRSNRDFAARLGLVPRQNSSVERKGWAGLPSTGQSLLRRLLVLGCDGELHKRPDPLAAWTQRLPQPALLVTVALANKLAHIAWAIMTTGELFRSEAPTAPA